MVDIRRDFNELTLGSRHCRDGKQNQRKGTTDKQTD